MFFNIANLDTKSVVAILGQVCSIVFDLFRFWSVFCDFHCNDFDLVDMSQFGAICLLLWFGGLFSRLWYF